MKKTVKVILIFLFSFILLGLGKEVKANSINKISMDIYINNKGEATVTEVWNCTANQGTEVYHPYYNLGKSQIKNLTVREKGINYETLSSWNTSGTLSSKAYKCGINKISNGVEICWGISEYGSHTYTVQYTITNFIAQLTDSQMLYWTFIPYDFSNSIGKAYIKVHTDFKIPDTVGVWGYGNYGGTAYVYNGYIEMQSSGSLNTSEYMTMLVQFPDNTFDTKNTINHNFDYYYQMAEEGSTKYNNSGTSTLGTTGSLFLVLFSAVATIISLMPFIIIIVAICVASKNIRESYGLNFGKSGRKMPKDLPYYRDIPCNKDIFRAYYIGYEYGLLKNKTDLLGAIILKWLKEGKIQIEQKETGGIFKKEDTVIILKDTDPHSIENYKEMELFNMLFEASKDGILENKEFERWCSTSYSKILLWFDDILDKEKTKLVEEGLIVLEEKTTFKIFTNKIYTATPELKQEAIELAGLKKFLKEYTLIPEREAIDVTLFEEYLIFAQIMGIAKEVAKEFKNLYPEIIEQSKFTSYDNIIFINMCATQGISRARSAESEAAARASSYSSGGGGFSSGGGGGGSFGGGGGGGGFR